MMPVLVATLFVALASSPALAGATASGTSAPEFTKSSLDGGTISRSDYDGRVLVLFLFGYG